MNRPRLKYDYLKEIINNANSKNALFDILNKNFDTGNQLRNCLLEADRQKIKYCKREENAASLYTKVN